MHPFRTWLRRSALLALVLFVGWVGMGAVHQHADDPTCQLCKMLHSGAASVGRAPDSPAPRGHYEPIALTAVERPAGPSLSATRVRGPPLG